MVFVPGAIEDVVSCASPLEFNVAVPRSVEPFWKVTVPVDTPEPTLVTTDVNVTNWFTFAGFKEEPSVVWVVCTPTPWLKEAEALARLKASPPYVAVMKLVPTGRVDVANWASAREFSETVPSTADPFLNVIIPVG